jgi:hypothetical protein
MGLRCLLGHEYANREVEREREERGNEVVVTYRTVETCDRCGERRVVSENKEVRPIRDPREEGVATGLGGGSASPDVDGPDANDAPATADGDETASDSGAAPTASAGDDDVVIDAEADADGDGDSESRPDPAEEDAVILEDEPTDDDGGDRGRGEWPSADAEAADASDPTVDGDDEGWPDTQGEDEGFDAEPDDGEPAAVSFGGGLTPDGTDAATNGSAGTPDGSGGAVAGKQFVAAEAVEPVSEESPGETEFFCPNCGYARVAGGSSMRAGDICPDCHKGYIAERET